MFITINRSDNQDADRHVLSISIFDMLAFSWKTFDVIVVQINASIRGIMSYDSLLVHKRAGKVVI